MESKQEKPPFGLDSANQPGEEKNLKQGGNNLEDEKNDTTTRQTATANNESPKEEKKKHSQAKQMVEMIQKNLSVFEANNETYAKVRIKGVERIFKTKSQDFRAYLVYEYARNCKEIPTNWAVEDAVRAISAQAMFEGDRQQAFVRVGEFGNKIYVDLTDSQNRAIEVDAQGWKIIQNPPINFLPKPSQNPLPVPIRGGNLLELNRFIKVPDEDLVMIISWLTFTLHPKGPFPILVLNGGQGASKSNLIRMLHAICDPLSSPNLSMPKSNRDLYIAAANSRILAFDNLSDIPNWFSDAICQISTGGDFTARKLYSDDEEIRLHATNPVILSGISDLIVRNDLADRSILIRIRPLTEAERRDEASLWAEFYQIVPSFLGSICDCLSAGLKNKDSIPCERLPRMADFAKFIIETESALPWEKGKFIEIYRKNISGVVDDSVENDQIGNLILKLMESRPLFETTAQQLIAALVNLAVNNAIALNQKEWPKAPNKLRGIIEKSLVSLEKKGIKFTFDVFKSGQKLIRVENLNYKKQPATNGLCQEIDSQENNPSPESTETTSPDEKGSDPEEERTHESVFNENPKEDPQLE